MENQKKQIRKRYKQLRAEMTPEQVAERSRRICGRILVTEEFRGADWIFAYYPLGNEADVRDAVREAWRQGKHVAFPKVSGEEMHFFEVHDFSELQPGTFGVMEPAGTDVRTRAVAFDTLMRPIGNSASKRQALGKLVSDAPMQITGMPPAVEKGKEWYGPGLEKGCLANRNGGSRTGKAVSVLMLVPGVAFDRARNRMGFGKGYYDRYLLAWRLEMGNGTGCPAIFDSNFSGVTNPRSLNGMPSLVTMGVAYDLQVAERIPTEETDIPLDLLVTEREKIG